MSTEPTIKWDQAYWSAVAAKIRNLDEVKSEISHRLLTDYEAIYSSYINAGVSVDAPGVLGLIEFARYLNYLNGKITAAEAEPINPNGLLETIHSNQKYFNTSALSPLLIQHDEFMSLWLNYASVASQRSVLFGHKQVRKKLGQTFNSLLNLPESSEKTFLYDALWDSFCRGDITEQILRYSREMGLSRETMLEGISRAIIPQVDPKPMLTSIENYQNWVDSYRWYHAIQILWAYVKWVFSTGENYDVTLANQINLLQLRLESLEHHRQLQQPINAIVIRLDGPVLSQQLGQVMAAKETTEKTIEELKSFMQRFQESTQESLSFLQQSIEDRSPSSASVSDESRHAQYMRLVSQGEQRLTRLRDSITKLTMENIQIRQQLNQVFSALNARVTPVETATSNTPVGNPLFASPQATNATQSPARRSYQMTPREIDLTGETPAFSPLG